MTKIPSSREVIRMLEAEGWVFWRSVGDHHHFRHPGRPGKVTVTHPVKAIPLGTLRSIYRQAGLDWAERK